MRNEPPITPNPRSPYDSPTDTLLLVALGLTLAASRLVWLAAQVAALCFGAHHPVHLGLSDMPGVLFQLAEHPADPRLAFPAAARAALPGPVGAYAGLVLTLLAPAALLVLVASPPPPPPPPPP